MKKCSSSVEKVKVNRIAENLCIWVLLPAAVSGYSAMTAPNYNSDMFDKIRSASNHTIYGTLRYSDLRRNNLKVVTSEGGVSVYCAPERRASDCVRGKLDHPMYVKLNYAEYRGYKVITSIESRGKNIITFEERVKQIQQRSAHALRQSSALYAKVGILSGLFISIVLKTVLVLRRKFGGK